MFEHRIISITFFERGLVYEQGNRNSICLLSTAFLSSLGFATLLTNGYVGHFPRDYEAKNCVQKILIQEISRRSRHKWRDNMKKEPKNWGLRMWAGLAWLWIEYSDVLL